MEQGSVKPTPGGPGERQVKVVELTGGPPWGFRIGAFTTVTTHDEDDGEEDMVELGAGGGGDIKRPENNVVGAVKIARVNPESKAAATNLRDGDLILSINGEDVQPPPTPVSSSSPTIGHGAPSDYHHKILNQFQGDKLRLSILSKKLKNSKKQQRDGDKNLQKPRMGEGETQPVHNETKSRTPASSVTWADGNQVLGERENSLISGSSVQTNGETVITDCQAEIGERSQGQTQDGEANQTTKMQAKEQGLLMCQGSSQDSTSKSCVQPEGPKPVPYASSLLIKRDDLHNMNGIPGSNAESDIPSIWSPPGVPPSPKLAIKFRPVNFNSVSLKNEYASPLSPDLFSPCSEPSVSMSTTDESSRLSHTRSQSSAATSSSASILPKYQSPTVVLLQKAREGQLPRGAAYLQPKQATDKTTSSVNYTHHGNTLHNFQTSGFPQRSNSKELQSPILPSKPSNLNRVNNIPMTSKSCVEGEKEQREWYKTMYEHLHVEKSAPQSAKCTYPAGKIRSVPAAKSFWAKRVHSNGTVSEPEDFDHPEEEEYDFNKFRNVMPTSSISTRRPVPPGAIRFGNPGRIEDYDPSVGAATSMTHRQRYHRQLQPDLRKHWALTSPTKLSGYESDSNYIIRKKGCSPFPEVKSPEPPPFSPAEQKQLYVDIQKGGDVPFQGLRRIVPGPGPRDPAYEDNGDGTASPSENIRYSESTVNIHYRAPVRIEEKQFVAEDELRKRQQQCMRQFYEEQRKRKFMKELEDMERRRHSDNFVPSQKSPIPLNRYEDDVFHEMVADTSVTRPGSGGLWQRWSPEPSTASRLITPIALARALYNFAAQNARELHLCKGDLILIRKKIDSNWYEGELRQPGKNTYFYPSGTSALGIFPCSYVEILTTDPNTISKCPIEVRCQDFEGLAHVLYNFRPSHSFELDLVKGEYVVLSRRVDRNWFEGRKEKKPYTSGIFPVSFVQVLKDIGARSETKSTATKKPVGQPVAHSLGYGSDTEDFSLKKHHYKPNEFVLHDESDYGDLVSPNLSQVSRTRDSEKSSKHRRRMNQRLELITIDTRLNNEQPFRFKVIYNYKPLNSDELELKEGDLIDVMEKCDDGWFVGTSRRTGIFGTFPGNYVEPL